MTSVPSVVIRAIAYGGDGVGRLDDGMAVFVPFTAVGDVVRIELESRHKRYARARVRELVTAGSGRTAPPCPYYGSCGGCVYQHLDSQAQLHLKRGQLQDLLQRLAKLTDLPELEGPGPAPAPYHYRNKATLRPLPPRTELDFGYTTLDNKTLFSVAACPLLHPELNQLLAELRTGNQFSALAADRPQQPLVLRRDTAGTLVAFRRQPAQLLHETVLGHAFDVPAGSFFQVNPPVLTQLATWIYQYFQQAATANLLDAYCGSGLFAALLAELVTGKLAAIESDHQALRRATANVKRPLLTVAGSVEKQLPQLLNKLGPSTTTVLLDPPRGGCEPSVIQALRACQPKQLIYVSCNPATFARDLALLTQPPASWRLQRLAIFDMFPQTAHFETVAILQ